MTNAIEMYEEDIVFFVTVHTASLTSRSVMSLRSSNSTKYPRVANTANPAMKLNRQLEIATTLIEH